MAKLKKGQKVRLVESPFYREETNIGDIVTITTHPKNGFFNITIPEYGDLEFGCCEDWVEPID